MTTFAASHLLLVDDDPDILSGIATYLRRRDLLVTTASCYIEADRILNDGSQPFDILVADVCMPDGSGVELCHTFMRRLSGGHSCILMTGHHELTDLSSDLLNSSLSVIHKPFSLAELSAKVHEALAPTPVRG